MDTLEIDEDVAESLARHQFYNTAEECADAAAPIFRDQDWWWILTGIPSRDQIVKELYRLKALGEQYQMLAESGRLCYYQERFGHERFDHPSV